MQNRLLHFSVLYSIVLLVAFSFNFTFGQNTSTSPYSFYGIGERDGLDNATFVGLGNSTITYFDSTSLNYFNPASYNTIAKGQPLFSIGLSSRISNYKENSSNGFTKYVLLNHLAMGFAFAKHFGFAFGLKPYSRRGYEITTREMLGTDSIKHSYLGSGSTNEVFIGFSSNVLKITKHQLTIGGNAGYVFGTLINERKSVFGTSEGGIDQKTMKINSFHYELGMYYKYTISDRQTCLISAVVEPNQNFTTNQKTDFFSSKFVDNVLSYRKLDSTDFVTGNVSLPTSTTIGANYTFKFNDSKKESKIRHSEISFHTSYNSTSWSDYKSTFSDKITSPSYSSTYKFTFGVQYIPEKSFLEQAGTSTFFETIRYRVGCYQYTLPIRLNGTSILDKGVTIGFGLPLKIQKSLSSINLGFSYGVRGDVNSTNLSEEYYGINVGVIFAPANFERWFIKRKLD